MYIREILQHKGTEVITVAPDTPVRHLVEALIDAQIGACVVSTDAATIVGIVSERDVAVGLARHGEGVLRQPVTAIATTVVHTAEPDDTVETVMRLMTHRRVRHVPIVTDGRLAGIVSLGDIIARRLSELEDERRHLTDYIHTCR